MYMSVLNIGRTYYVTLLETETNSICPRLKTNHFQNKVIYNFTVFIIAISLYRTCHFKTVTLSRKSAHDKRVGNSLIMFMYKRRSRVSVNKTLFRKPFPVLCVHCPILVLHTTLTRNTI